MPTCKPAQADPHYHDCPDLLTPSERVKEGYAAWCLNCGRTWTDNDLAEWGWGG